MHEIWFRTHPAVVHPQGLEDLAYVLVACILLLGLVHLNYRVLEIPSRRRGVVIATRFGS